MKYFLEISYLGTQYHGWQRQPNVTSVQEILETQLSRLLKESITVIGCGRTDTGVHASHYMAHINTFAEIEDAFIFRINKILPPDIAVHKIYPVAANAHAQHNARWRTYDYFIHAEKNPLIHHTSSEIDFREYNFKSMQQAMKLLLSIKDFHAVCKNPAIYKTTLCDIRTAEMSLDEIANKLQMRFTANRFLRSMVRLLVSNVLKVGAGRISLDEFTHHMIQGKRFPFYEPAPAQGLHLSGIEYDLPLS